MRSPWMTGDECPGGSGVFQTTYWSGPISAGSGLSPAAMALPPGPRNWGQEVGAVESAPGRQRAIAHDRRSEFIRQFSKELLPTGRSSILIERARSRELRC